MPVVDFQANGQIPRLAFANARERLENGLKYFLGDSQNRAGGRAAAAVLCVDLHDQNAVRGVDGQNLLAELRADRGALIAQSGVVNQDIGVAVRYSFGVLRQIGLAGVAVQLIEQGVEALLLVGQGVEAGVLFLDLLDDLVLELGHGEDVFGGLFVLGRGVVTDLGELRGVHLFAFGVGDPGQEPVHQTLVPHRGVGGLDPEGPEIGDFAFSGCGGLTSVKLPESLTTVGRNPFSCCRELTRIEISPDQETFGVDGNVLFNRNDKTLICYPIGLAQSGYVIPEGTQTIGYGAFQWCANLTSIEIPETVTTIEAWAFEECDGLTSVEIPGSVTTIGEMAFKNCDTLKSIKVPGSVTSIGEEALSSYSDPTLIVERDSYAEKYAVENEIPYTYAEE